MKIFNTAFGLAALFAAGSANAGTIYNSYTATAGASYYDTDVRLQRLFNATERFKINLSAEVLNLLNRVNVQDVDQVYGAGEFAGPIPKAYGDGVTSPDNPTFGTPTFAGAARQFQLSAKFSF